MNDLLNGLSRRRAWITLPLLSALGALPLSSHAQDYPRQSIRLVLPFPPGGPTDLLTRLVAVKMGAAMGQTFVIDNKPGASGMIGAEAVARATPNGYTLLSNASLHIITPIVQTKMRYDAVKDFEPITQLAEVPLVLVVNINSPIKTVADLIALAKSGRERLNFGSPGNASSQHLAGESFKLAAKVAMQHVPYKGSAPALTDLMGGQIQLMFDSMPSAMPFIKSGKLRAIAVTTAKRSSALPDVPTVAESGLPGFNISTWYGLWAPHGTPGPIVAQLSKQAALALKQPDIHKQYVEMGAEPVGSTPEEFARYILAERAKWEDVVRRADVKAGE